MTERFLSNNLSYRFIREFFMFFFILVTKCILSTKWILSTKSILKRFWLMYLCMHKAFQTINSSRRSTTCTWCSTKRLYGKPMWEITTHMLVDKAQIERLEVSETMSMEWYGKGYDFTVLHMGKYSYGAACQIVKVYFFSTQEYNICKNCWEYRIFLLILYQ